MSPKAFAILAVTLKNLPPQFDQKWDANVHRWYIGELTMVPDSDVIALGHAISQTCEKRPTPATVLAVWRDLTAKTGRTAVDVVGKLFELRDKYGNHPVKRTETGPHGSEYTVWLRGEPQWTDDVLRKVVACLGGWLAWVEGESGPASVERGQMIRIAEQVLAGAGDARLTEIRAEVRQLRQENEQRRLEGPQE